MRSLHPGPGGWTPAAPLVADTSCCLSLERQSKQAPGREGCPSGPNFLLCFAVGPVLASWEGRTEPSPLAGQLRFPRALQTALSPRPCRAPLRGSKQLFP